MSWASPYALGQEQAPLPFDVDWAKLQALGPDVYEAALQFPFMAVPLQIAESDVKYAHLLLQTYGYVNILRSLFALEFDPSKVEAEILGLKDVNREPYQSAGKSYTWFVHLFEATQAKRTAYKAMKGGTGILPVLTTDQLKAIVEGQPGWTPEQQAQAKLLYEAKLAKAKPAGKGTGMFMAAVLLLLVVVMLGRK